MCVLVSDMYAAVCLQCLFDIAFTASVGPAGFHTLGFFVLCCTLTIDLHPTRRMRVVGYECQGLLWPTWDLSSFAAMCLVGVGIIVCFSTGDCLHAVSWMALLGYCLHPSHIAQQQRASPLQCICDFADASIRWRADHVGGHG